MSRPLRALIAEPTGVSAARYRRFWRRAQLDALLPDLMVRGEPYLALNAWVLSAGGHALLARLTRVFSGVFHTAGQRVAADVAATIKLGFPWAAAELLSVEPPRVPIVGRFDFVQDESGRWRLLELNADTPSGIREGITCDRLVYEQVSEAAGLARPSAILGERLTEAILGAVEPVGRGGALGVITTASELEDLSQMAFTARLVTPALAARGLDVVLGDAGNLRLTARGLTLRGQRVDAVYRYLPFEAIFGTPTFAALEEAVALGTVTVLNGLYGLLLQNKGLLAWIWAHRDDAGLFDADERCAIVEHLPATWMLEDAPAHVPRQDLVAKQVFGREGQEVFFGEDCSAELWATLAAQQTYIGQERVRVGRSLATVQTSTGSEVREGHATVGAFAVNGEFGGYYTRFGEKIITSSSKWLGTFAERGDGNGDGDVRRLTI
ncbi:MAG: glutathionylspermidine synthase family protein [Chloroflexi bacterium]|nr:glutathionylspermidine synthase family protein [Chloroflexota bacterium]